MGQETENINNLLYVVIFRNGSRESIIGESLQLLTVIKNPACGLANAMLPELAGPGMDSIPEIVQ